VTQSATISTAVAAPPSVLVTDTYDNPVSGYDVTFTVTAGSGTIVPASPATVATNSSGVATLTSWTLGSSAGTNNNAVEATAALTGSPVIFTASGTASNATQLTVTQQPAGARSGIALTTVPTVQVKDAGNNPVEGVTVSVAVVEGDALAGTTSGASDASGNVTFTGLTITGTAGSKTLRFTAAGPLSVDATPLTLGAGAAAKLAFTGTPPTTGNVAAALAPITVQLQDAQSNPLDSTGAAISAAITTDPGGTPGLTGSAANTGAGGSATFSSLVITGLTGGYQLTFSATGLTSVTTATITLAPGVPNGVSITTGPAATIASGELFTPVVNVTDAGGNPVPNQDVTVSLATGTGSFTGTTTVQTNGSGNATFTDIAVNGTATTGYSLRFTAGSATVTSGTFELTVGVAKTLFITTQPVGAQTATPLATQPVVEFRDSGNNLVSSTANVTAVLVGDGGVLAGTTAIAAVGGVATFTDLAITGVGTYQIRFDATGVTSATSGDVTISP
jgi:5-hydroxyisourate hydrolase-like protein (transthyretin family)